MATTADIAPAPKKTQVRVSKPSEKPRARPAAVNINTAKACRKSEKRSLLLSFIEADYRFTFDQETMSLRSNLSVAIAIKSANAMRL